MRYIIIAAFLGLSSAGISQEPGVYTQYHLNPVLLNPGATGHSGAHEFLFNYRNKWASFDGAARDFTFMYHGAVGDRIGLGGQLYTERIGRFRSFQGTASYAYRIVSDSYNVGIGITTGIQQLRLSSEFDPFLDDTDALLNEALDGVLLFDASFGVYGEYEDALYFGVSFPNLVRSRISEIQGDEEDPNEEFNYAALIGYRFKIKNYNFVVEPSLAVKNIRRVPFHIDLNLKLSFLDEQLVGGVTYSLGDESRCGVLLGTRIDALKLFYGYDVSFGEFQDFNSGSHELTIQYNLPKLSLTQTQE
ncbi:MAG TPA: PorP/SprF family type IX secretion system membrane protein [Saprospiraceae bacterium]|nr:PorP/SprF family type IX secretion system membrane protein [Saprospiraceae bacterium]